MSVPLLSLGIAILAGGLSRRMGVGKAWVLLDGKPLISHVIARMRTLAPTEIFVITPDPMRCAGLGVQACTDIFPGKGPLGGLHYRAEHTHKRSYRCHWL